MSKGVFTAALQKAMACIPANKLHEVMNGMRLSGPQRVFRLEADGLDRTYLQHLDWNIERVHLGTFSSLNNAYEAALKDFAKCKVNDELVTELELEGELIAKFYPVPTEGNDALDIVYFVYMYELDVVIDELVKQ